MNRIYRKVWNNALGQVVVASEMAKGRKKASKSVGAACLTAVVLSGLAFNAFALNPNGSAPLIINDMAFGVNDSGQCQAIGGDGTNTFSTVSCNSSSQTAGLYNNALQTSSVVVATNSLSVGGYQLINGADSSNNALNITAAGAKILLNNGKVTGMAAGTVSGSSADAINGAQLFNSNQAIATAFGTSVNAGGNVSAPSYALANANAISGGTGAATDVATGFAKVDSALGKLDTRVTTNATNISTLQTTVNNISGGTVGLVQQAAAGANLTVGTSKDGVAVDFADKNGNTRTLKNVTAGVSATDAVNMSQLNTTNANVATNTANIATNTANLSSLGSATASSLGGGAAYNSATGTLSVPSYTVQGSTYNNVGSALGGLDTSVTNNINSISSLTNQVNSGTTGLVQQAGAGADLTVGKDTVGAAVNFADKNGNTRTLSNVTAGVNDTDAVNMSQLNTTNTNVATNSTNIAANTASIATNATNIATNVTNLGNLGNTAATALGGSTIYTPATGLSGTSFGLTNANAIAGTTGAVTDVTSGFNKVDSALGTLNTAVINNATAIAGNASSITNISNQINGGTVGLVQQAAAGADLTVGNATDGAAVNFADKNGNARTLSNVTAGVNETDAVNMSQLNSTNANVSTNATNIAANTASIATNTTNIATNVTNLSNLGSTAAAALGGTTSFDPTAGSLSGTSFSLTSANAIAGTTGAATDVTSGFNKVDGALGTLNTAVTNNTTAIAGNTSSISNITNQINSGAIGPVQQTGATNQLALVAAGGTGAAPGTAQNLTNVADGALNASSTDAVNGSQLNTTNANVSTNATNIAANTASIVTNTSNIATNATNFGNLGNTMAVALGGSTIYTPATGLSGTSFGLTNANAIAGTTGAATDVTSGFSKVDGALGTINSSVTNISNQINSGTVGLVQQAGAGANLTVGKDTDGIVVDVSGTAGKRKITGVADGDMSNGSSDAVNGSQLYATNQQIANNTNSISNIQSTISNISNGSSGAFQMSRDRSGAMPVSSGTNSAAGGANATASGANSVAVGNDSTTSGNNAAALGQGATASGAGSTAVGQGAKASNPNDVALGSGSVTSAAVAVNSATVNGVTYSNFAGSHPIGAVSVGSAGNDRQIQNVAAGQITATSTDAVNGSQLYSVASQMTNMAGQVSGVTNQVDTNTTNVTNLQNGSAGMFQVSGDANSTQPVASGTQSTAGGNGAVASGASSTAVGNNAQATGNNSVAIGAGSVATQANTVSVGSAGNERQIKNVAAGTQATDAVNVSQLQSSQAGTVHYDANTDGSVDTGSVTLNSGGSSASIHNVSAGTAVTDAVNVGQMNNGLRQVADWSKSYSDTIGHQASAGVASAMAMAGVPVAYAPNQSSVGVGVGSFRGESSFAVGMSTISESGRYVFKASATSDTRGDRGVSLGAGITF